MGVRERLYATDDPGVFEPYTHRVWRCQECGHEVLVPEGQLESQVDHANRPFCLCESQGVRMVPVPGVEGRVRL